MVPARRALAIGAELHWIRGHYEQQSRDLLVEAYRQLGREARAQIADVPARHRDLRTVDVFTYVPPDPSSILWTVPVPFNIVSGRR